MAHGTLRWRKVTVTSGNSGIRGTGYLNERGAGAPEAIDVSCPREFLVTSIPVWMGIQALFHGVQCVLAGAVIGLAYGRND